MQKKYTLLLLGTGLIIAIFLLKKTSTPEVVKQVSNITATPTEFVSQEKSSDYFYPLTNYSSRINVRKFGQYFGPNDPKPNMVCGRVFVGFHDGDDLEVTDAEQNSDVPVYAVATGKILQVGNVDGYGGLLVQQAEINGEPVTIYYGHIGLDSVSKKAGDELEAGEIIGNLGKGCSEETDNERKHLHFAVKKGTGVDVRGYVPSADILSSWKNPSNLLVEIKASNLK